jgi:hypothetical protein
MKIVVEKSITHTESHQEKVDVESYLGVPSQSGMVLASDTQGNRSWVEAGASTPEVIDGGEI